MKYKINEERMEIRRIGVYCNFLEQRKKRRTKGDAEAFNNLGMIFNQFWGVPSKENLIRYYKASLYPAHVIKREDIIAGGEKRAIDIYKRYARKKSCLVASIVEPTKLKGSAGGYKIVVIKGRMKFFIIVKYYSPFFNKIFQGKDTSATWKTDKENFDWLKNHKKLKIHNKKLWEQFEAYSVAVALSESGLSDSANSDQADTS